MAIENDPNLVTLKGSSLSLLCLVLIAIAFRMCVRIFRQKQFGMDDFFVLLGTCCLVVAFGVLAVFIDEMYLVEAVTMSLPGFVPPADVLQQSYDFHKWLTVFGNACWFTVCCTKYSFLFFFRKLIDRLHYLRIYWWIVVLFVTGVLVFYAYECFMECPYYYSVEACLYCITSPSSIH